MQKGVPYRLWWAHWVSTCPLPHACPLLLLGSFSRMVSVCFLLLTGLPHDFLQLLNADPTFVFYVLRLVLAWRFRGWFSW